VDNRINPFYLHCKVKRGGTRIIVSIIIGIIIIIGLIFLLIVVSQETQKKEETKNVTNINLYINSVDSDNKKQLESDYMLLTESGQFLSSGKLSKDSLIEVPNISKEQKIIVFCYGSNHYSSKIIKEFSQSEKDNNASKVTCYQDPIGTLKIENSGNLQGINNILKFNITSDKSFKKLSAVLKWRGIINVDLQENTATCDKWINYSYYNEKEKIFSWLPQNHYLCGNTTQKCSKLDEQICLLSQDIPLRFNKLVDKAISTGKDINKEITELTLYVKTEELKTTGDYIEITFYDEDLVYEGGQFILTSESEGKNIGNPSDLTFRIYYEQ